jgi:hypothetical protein
MMPRWAAFDVVVGVLQQAQQDVLDVFADVAGLGDGGGVADGEGYVEDAGEGFGEQGLAAAGGADEQDVALSSSTSFSSMVSACERRL